MVVVVDALKEAAWRRREGFMMGGELASTSSGRERVESSRVDSQSNRVSPFTVLDHFPVLILAERGAKLTA